MQANLIAFSLIAGDLGELANTVNRLVTRLNQLTGDNVLDISANTVTLANTSKLRLGGASTGQWLRIEDGSTGTLEAFTFDTDAFAANATVTGTFAQNVSVYATFAQNTAVYATFAQNSYVNVTFAANSYVNSTFAANSYVNAQLALKAANSAVQAALATKADNTSLYATFAQNTNVVAKSGGNFTGAVTIQGNTIWRQGNDGDGSGLDADLWKGADYTVSTSGPTGGNNGDFWFEREA